MEAWIRDLRKSMKEKEKKRKNKIILVVVVSLVMIFIMAGYSWAKKNITVNIDGKVTKVTTFQTSVADVLEDQDIVVNEGDILFPKKSSILRDGMTITIQRAFPVFIDVDGTRYQHKTTSSTVKKILQAAGVKVAPVDIVEPKLDTEIQNTKIIKVTRVTQETVTEKIKIPFKVEYLEDNNLEKGLNKIAQRGKEGLLHREWLVTYHDGKEVKREIVSERIITEPVNKKVEVGTKTVLARGGEVLRFKKAINVVTTAYTYTGKNTYTGTSPQKGTVAVDPDVIPLGSRLYIEGYGYATAQDVGSSIKGNRIDLFMETREEALKWGRRKTKVYILE
ncbi:MAG: hypothetical protein PWQ96_1486 [Clostridia bacterium]|nr:hypothetical protein [Clostridia bacterium]